MENILIAGHSLAKYESRRKYTDALKYMPTDVYYIFLTPPEEKSVIRKYGPENEMITERENLVKLDRFGSDKHWLYFHSLKDVFKIFNKFQPKILLIENEPHSFLAIQLFLCLKIWSIIKNKKNKIVLFSWDNLNREDGIIRFIYKKAINFLITRNLDLIICGNAECKKIFIDKGVKRQKLVVYPQMGMDFSIIKKFKNNMPSKECSIIYCGRIVYEKGIHILIKTFLELQRNGYKPKLLLAGKGKGKYFREIKKEIKKIKNINLIETLSKEKMYETFSKYTFFVLPSITTKVWKEQFGFTIAESMSLPQILSLGSNSGAIPEVLKLKECVFEENDYLSIFNKIKYFMDNPKEKAAISLLQSEIALKNYSNEAVGKLYGQSLSKLLLDKK